MCGRDAYRMSKFSRVARYRSDRRAKPTRKRSTPKAAQRSEEHTSELQSLAYLVCRLLLEKKKRGVYKVLKRHGYSLGESRSSRSREPACIAINTRGVPYCAMYRHRRRSGGARHSGGVYSE